MVIKGHSRVCNHLVGEEDRTRSSEAWRKYLVELTVIVSKQLEALELGEYCLGQRHRVVSKLRSDLV